MNKLIILLDPIMRRLSSSNRHNSAQSVYFSKSTTSIILSITMVIVFSSLKTTLAQQSPEDCEIERGAINASNSFSEDSMGKDFEINCSGALNIQLTDESIKSLVESQDENYEVEEGSKFRFELTGITDTINLTDISLIGNVSFAVGQDDAFNINIKQSGSGSIIGDVNFDDGVDAMTINVAPNQSFEIDGMITGLETMTKKGGGYLRLANNLTLTASTNTQGLKLENGYLVIVGDLNLGSGALTVEDLGKLVFEIKNGNTYGKVTAGTVHFAQSEPVVFAQLSEDSKQGVVKNTDTLKLFDVTDITRGSDETTVSDNDITVKSKSSDGTNVDVGTVDASGLVSFTDASKITVLVLPNKKAPDTSGNSSGGGSSSSDSAGAILGLGLLAVLLSSFAGDEEASASFGDYYFNTPQSAYIAKANERGVLTIKETGNQPYQMWIRTGHTAQPMRMTGVSNTGVSGTEVGINLYNSDTFYINTEISPKAVRDG